MHLIIQSLSLSSDGTDVYKRQITNRACKTKFILTKPFAKLNVSSDYFCLDAFTYQISRLWGIESVEAFRFSMTIFVEWPQA